MKEGKGKYKFRNGDEYVGQFFNDYMQGSGVLFMIGGDLYDG